MKCMPANLLAISLIPVGMLLMVGCGGPYDSTVTGMVTLAGNPLPRGTVSFIPQSQGAAAYGTIASDGRYVVRTGREEGVASGQYTVTVVASEPSAQARGKDGGPPPMGKSITPQWYGDAATSGLNYTVEPGDNEINIELTTTPPAGWKPPPGRRR